MKRRGLTIAFLALTGCATQPAPPTTPNSHSLALAETLAYVQAQIAKEKHEQHATLNIFFPPHAQAISLGLLSFRRERNKWPTSEIEFNNYILSEYKNAAPARREFSNLAFKYSRDDAISFKLTTTSQSRISKTKITAIYTIAKDGRIDIHVIDWDNTPAGEFTETEADFTWSDFLAKVTIGLIAQIAAESTK